MNNTAVIITTLNEADTIGDLVRSLRLSGYYVIVSDGGSTDGTAMIAHEAGARVLTANERLPIADAIMAGMRRVLDFDFARIVVMDAGGSHDVDDLARLLAVDADVVIGSRFVPGAQYHGRFWRALLSRLAAVLCNVAQPGANYHDWTSGFRVYNREAVEVILSSRYQTSMHTWQIETLARLGEAGMTIEEAPITYRAGRSSFSWSTVGDAVNVWLHLFNHVGWRREKATA